MLFALRTILLAACALGAGLAGCRGERPDAVADGDGTAEAGTTAPGDTPEPPTEPGKPEDVQFPDEPSPDIRAQLQAGNRMVITVHPHGVTWVDGELAFGPDLFMRLQAERRREGGPRKVVLFIADAANTPLEAWRGFTHLLRDHGFQDDQVDIIFGGEGYEGLRPPPPTTAPAGGSDG